MDPTRAAYVPPHPTAPLPAPPRAARIDPRGATRHYRAATGGHVVRQQNAGRDNDVDFRPAEPCDLSPRVARVVAPVPSGRRACVPRGAGAVRRRLALWGRAGRREGGVTGGQGAVMRLNGWRRGRSSSGGGGTRIDRRVASSAAGGSDAASGRAAALWEAAGGRHSVWQRESGGNPEREREEQLIMPST